jgi:hypothetical protein
LRLLNRAQIADELTEEGEGISHVAEIYTIGDRHSTKEGRNGGRGKK